MRSQVLLFLSLALVWAGPAQADPQPNGETNSNWATCGKTADVLDDEGKVLFTLGEFERLILEPGWLEKAKELGKRNVLIPALFPTRQSTRAWINAYSIGKFEDCDHFTSKSEPSTTSISVEEQRNNSKTPVNVEAGKNYVICTEPETNFIYTTDLKNSGVPLEKYEKIYLEEGWKENTKLVKFPKKKKKVAVTPVSFPGRGFLRGYVRSELVTPLLECPVYQVLLNKIEENERIRMLHMTGMSDEFGGFATKELQMQARYALLEKLNLPQKFARTEEAVKIAELVKVKKGILQAADDAEKAAGEALINQGISYDAFKSAEALALTAEVKHKDASLMYRENVRIPQQFALGINVNSTLDDRSKLGPMKTWIASAEFNLAFVRWEAAEARLTAELARKASFEAALETMRLRTAALRARAEANRYRLSIFPLKLEEKDLAGIAYLEKNIATQTRYMPEVSSLVANAKAETQKAYSSRRALGGRQIGQFMMQSKMDQAMTAVTAAKTKYDESLAVWNRSRAAVQAARFVIRELTTGGRAVTDAPPDEYAEALKVLADAKAKSALLYFEATKLKVALEQAKLAAEEQADSFFTDFVSLATVAAKKEVEHATSQKNASQKQHDEDVAKAASAQAKVDKILGMLRELIEANKDIRKKKRKHQDAEIDATVAGNLVTVAERNAKAAIESLKALPPKKTFSDSSLETYQWNVANMEAKKRYDAAFEAEELAKIEPLRVKAAEEHVRAAKLKIEEMEAKIVSAELILKIEITKEDPKGSVTVEKCRGDVETAKANLASAQLELADKETKLTAANEAASASEKRAKEAREVISKGNERVRDSAARLEGEQKKREEVAAAVLAAEQAAREAQWKKMAALYPPGFETARTEAAKNYAKYMREQTKKLGQQATDDGIPWQEEGLQFVPGEIPDEMIEEMVEKYKGQNCRTTDTDELKCMACNLWFEARGETHDGKMLSARSVMNRMKSEHLGDNTVCEVIYHWKQYSWANILRDNPDAKKMPTAKNDDFWAFPLVMKASIQALQEETPYILNHYWAVGSAYRKWQGQTMCKLTKVRIDNHYACYLPIGDDKLALDEVRELLKEDPEALGREE